TSRIEVLRGRPPGYSGISFLTRPHCSSVRSLGYRWVRIPHYTGPSPPYRTDSKTYYGLLRGNLQLGSLLKDEKEKIAASGACCYCGSALDLPLDHLIPQFKGGEHSADNLVVACRSCNSSKKALDLLEWMAKRGEFPPLRLLRRYLKLAIRYCIE